MSEKTTDDEQNDEDSSPKRSVIDEIRHRRADERDETGESGSKLRTLLFLGFAFVAGYLVGKSQSKSDFREELGEFSGTDGGPMEIEIHDTDSTADEDANDEDEDDREGNQDDEEEENEDDEE